MLRTFTVCSLHYTPAGQVVGRLIQDDFLILGHLDIKVKLGIRLVWASPTLNKKSNEW
jgi:hypothetical protein